ncbi:MAG TPA: cbb3-type cytochrome c oxidase N-terminal domain-containing protein, partial [Planctomycetota bacterium]|nr:cbb3-type cytochrome c oxidase N-terminal domain-containing protein [Planctomycetota bacterium]
MAESKRAGDQDKVVHVYDGIVEEDNELPRWWLATFWGAIVFAVIYWVVYHSLGVASLPLEAYGEEMAKRAGSAGEVSDDLLEAMAQVPGEVEGGKKLFETHCAVCHGQSGEGLIGPNLTDDMWIHGGAAMDIYKSIRDGIPSAGMPNWGPPLGEANTRKLATFVISLRGKNLPVKEPQGTPWSPDGEAAGEPEKAKDAEGAADAAADPSEAAAE